MAFSHGKSARIYANGYKMSDYLNKIETPLSVDTSECTVFNSSDAKSYLVGNADATLSGEGLFDSSTGAIDRVMDSALGSSQVVWTWYPEGDSTGNRGYGFKTHMTNYSITSPIEGIVSLSIEGQSAIGGRDSVESLKALSSIYKSTNGASDDNAASSTRGGVAYFQRTDNSTRGIAPIIQHSSAGTSWATLVSFSSGTSRSGQRVAFTGTAKRYTRSGWTLTGSTLTAVTVHFAISRK